MGGEGGSAYRNGRSFDGCQQAATFYMEMFAAGGVKGNLGKKIRRRIGCARIVGGIELCTQSRVKGKGKYDFSGAHKLLRVLDFRCPYPLVIEVIRRPERRGAGVVVAYANPGILLVSKSHIGRQGRNPRPVGRLQAPGLAAQKLPLPAPQIQPKKTETVGVAVGGDEHVGRIVAVEVGFN